ncbi:ABC transporter ATP-binding protein [Methanobrevibacter sp.]|uniref:ABC transporter ATP-binding protein n=1 Tax=Methanobrevibacter sp. TaxID=66852 RepID=UPI003890F806
MMRIFKPLKNKIPSMIVIGIFLVISAYCSLTLPQYTAEIIDVGIKNSDIPCILDIGTKMMMMVLIAALSSVIVSFLSSRVSSGYAKDLRNIVYAKILKFSNHELNHISKSSLITRSTNDITQIQTITEMTLTTIIFAPILGFGSVIKVFQVDYDLSWIIFVIFILILLTLVLFVKKVVPYLDAFQKITDEMNQRSREILMGIPVIKAFVRQDYEEEKFGDVNKRLLDLNLYLYKYLMLFSPLLILILNIMVIEIIYFGSFQIAVGDILTGEVVSFVQYSSQVISAFLVIGNFMITLPRIIISARRVNEILDTELAITDGELDNIEDNATIEFKNVSYQYPGSEKETLKGINMKLEPGKTTAIIGGTGSGKSTILSMIPRLQDPTSGEILINGVNIKNFTLSSLRDKISFAPQQSLLLSGTVRSNMLVGKQDASDQEIETALKNAHVNFIDGLDEEVVQGGANFSGGQKQRLSIARALLNPSEFYLFDDCFSALDMNTEKIVKDNLKKLNSSVLIVSQRISTIRDADEIIVVEDGEIVDRGSHDSLLGSCEIYRDIVDSQKDTLGGI